MHRGPTLLATVMLIHAAVGSTFWSGLWRATVGGSYEDRRISEAFGGLDVDLIGRRLDALTQDQRPIALDATLSNDPFTYQRLTEALYPRVIDSRATARLVAVHASAPTGDGEAVAAFGPLRFELTGIGVRGSVQPAARQTTSLGGDVLAGIDAWLGALSLGVLVSWVVGRRMEDATALPSMLLLGALVVALAVTVMTWLQATSPTALMGLGFATSASLGLWTLRTPDRRAFWARSIGAIASRRENFVLGLFLALFAFRMLRSPISLWDGRSIWIFNAKRIFEHGLFLVSDLTHADARWAHPDYPLFFPSWLAFFGGHGAVMSERGAALGIAALFAVVFSLDWHLARTLLGRFCGGAFVLALSLVTDWITAGGYADGLLRLLLVGEFLAFASGPGHRRTGWIIAACASLMKAEGLVFALLIAVAFLLRGRGPQRESLVRRVLPFLIFAPALAHLTYVNSHGIDTLLRSNIFGIDRFFARLGDVLFVAPSLLVQPSYTQLQPALWQGVLGAIGLLFALVCRQKPSAVVTRAALLALAMSIFAVGSISALPEDVTFLVSSALDRLLLHPAAFLTLAALLALRAPKGKQA